MDIKFLDKLFELFDKSEATEFYLEEEDTKITLTKNKPESNIDIEKVISLMGSMQHAHAAPIAPAPQAIAPPVQSTAPSATTPENNTNESNSNLHEITSPIVGTFYKAPSPDSAPFVEVGSRVNKGDTLCIVEAMKLMNEIESDVSGIVEKILINNSDPVEFGQVMFLIKPE